ncbi:hypothetical protein [Singulisphaera sp. PoT]|uniref:hypothetical protein n=1 Tax=Singulisphaera sp. PoT TaxID=3411797 RepID=UPI003BF5FC09
MPMMDRKDWQDLVEQLRGRDFEADSFEEQAPLQQVEFDAGMSDGEIVAAERRFGFRFPPDLRDFLQTALPKGPEFPDWRSGDEAALREWLDIPRSGVLFDIERNGFWLDEWGPRPATMAEALRRGEEIVLAAPKLIPIFAHRMMPEEPQESGNPVFSVHQTDIIHYGFDLADYLRHEFDLPGREEWPDRVRPIRFWDIERFQAVRWGADGIYDLDDSEEELP